MPTDALLMLGMLKLVSLMVNSSEKRRVVEGYLSILDRCVSAMQLKRKDVDGQAKCSAVNGNNGGGGGGSSSELLKGR